MKLDRKRLRAWIIAASDCIKTLICLSHASETPFSLHASDCVIRD